MEKTKSDKTNCSKVNFRIMQKKKKKKNSTFCQILYPDKEQIHLGNPLNFGSVLKKKKVHKRALC